MLIASAFVLGAGFLFRFWATSNPYLLALININEVVSPITSWKRVTEGLFLKRNGISPYEGDVFHQTPLMLNFLDWIEGNYSQVLPGLFVVFDVLLAILIGRAAVETGRFMLLLQQKSKPHYHKNVDESLLLNEKSFRNAFVYTSALYLFNPYSLAACVAKSTAVFDNMILALMVILTLKGWRVLSTFLLALLAYQNFYSIMLVVPVAICFLQRDVLGLVKYINPTAVKSILLTLSLTMFWLVSLLYYSFTLTQSWDFIRSTYGFVIMVPELTPNMGIFWYFFTEVFQHFELFFIIVFQVNAFIYTIPLAIKLRNHSVFLLYTLIVLISIFKSYPTYADVGFYLSFIPCWSFTHKYMKNVFIVSNMYIWCAALSPVFYHLWIYAGSANANFYFALTLVFNGAQIFFISDLILAYLRRDFDLHHPLPAADTDKAKLTSSQEVDDVILS